MEDEGKRRRAGGLLASSVVNVDSKLEKLEVEDNESVAKHQPNTPDVGRVRTYYPSCSARDRHRFWQYPMDSFA